MKILHLDSSIQGDASATRAVSAAIVARLRALEPSAEVAYRDLAAASLPHITLAGLGSAESATLVDELLGADVVVIGTPMYNFGLPTQLKAWFDHVLIAGRTFRYTAQGPEGLAGGKRVFLALSRGGIYSEGPMAANEHAASHVTGMLGFMGITDLRAIVVEGVAIGPEQREAALSAALDAAGRIELTDAAPAA
ncbi:FMN-dependent NADH-azoreductase [Novosphingobium album (ex Liu et al. 2023)]|uniref:FMN dependent NADH:quinone oxidoreductase n=1 Tax=Novosphingobium album (ex Liu et al. 2023) TaxID=3031130 RepID=A0ABT5WLD2_9SPHN|nr:NAD(P)H-dependent oxidoreductase [Novosphingobium album (ex Liu et al. 2023)]MDE8650857.1 NAD(P)H-dependent oxidoreductase [Novosphingobium album (ex Liu et al. 2023)]